ncbi:hypothetical protein HA402_006051 [Bradysia odoriphaga]|nr:hypothetical protein HA402_006051 [Bradysia odoriphaga]
MFKFFGAFFITLLTLLTLGGINCAGNPLVRITSNGPVEGIEQTSSLGQSYYSFRGIPFAEPPITGKNPYTGKEVDLRFKAPAPLNRTWTENLKAHNFGGFCIPSHIGNITDHSTTSEDCLFVNIYVPSGGAEKKTVLVSIYGGGFVLGDAGDMMYGPDFLLSQDNIVVTIQYRIGIFGFLTLASGEYTGNMGLKDQQLAIKWVHENIEAFSGNRNEILLFGESAGATSVGLQMLNVESRKYFNRAYLGSSSAFNFYAISKVDHSQQLKEFFKINDESKLIEYLRKTNSDLLSSFYPLSAKGKSLYVPWVPTIENPNTVGAFMTKTPEEIYSSNNAPIMDTMFSIASKESVGLMPELIAKTEPLIKENVEKSDLELPFHDFDRSTYPKEYNETLEKLRKVYYTDPTNPAAVVNANIALMSDIMFSDVILKGIVLQTTTNNRSNDNSGRKNTFFFRFSFDAGLNYVKVSNNFTYEGASHADELCYMFHCHAFDKNKLYDSHLEKKDVAYDLIMRMVKMVTNFARTGNPSIENDTPFKAITSQNDLFCQEITNDPKSSVTTDIKDQFHYDTWREIEETYRRISSNNTISVKCSSMYIFILLLIHKLF